MSESRVPGLDETAVRRLIAEGEPAGVERKTEVPRGSGLGPSAAAFANTRGGWILLGVDDAGQIVGWRPTGRAHIHDHLRELLQAVDPMPAFNAGLVETAEGSVGVVHIPESPIKPHLIKDKGVVYEREPGGNRPISSQAKLLALATSPKQAQAEAVERLTALPMVRAAMQRTIAGQATNGQTRVADWIVAATPLGVAPELAGHVRDGSQVRAIEACMAAALAVLTQQPRARSSETLPQPSGLVIQGVDHTTHDEFEFTVDAAGVAVARWSQRLYRGEEHLFALADRILVPLLAFDARVLAACGAVGPSHVHGLLRIRATNRAWSNTLAVRAADQSAHLTTDEHPIWLGAGLELPVDDQKIHEQADEWAAELGRHAGMATWQRPQS